MSAPREAWVIVVGNDAVVTHRALFFGTALAAVRRANRRWRARSPEETSLNLHHPGCLAYRYLTEGTAK